jgi:altronate hydrolase
MPRETTSVVPLEAFAIVVNPADNVAVVKTQVESGLVLRLPDGRDVGVCGTVTPGHRFATRVIPAGDLVLQYGQPIGTSRGMQEGDPVTSRSMSNEVPVVRDLPAEFRSEPPRYAIEAERRTFTGFRRANGRVGTRNFLLIVPTSMCASHESQQISMMAEFSIYKRERFPNVDGVVAIPHTRGCGCADGSNIQVMLRTLANYAAHPNVGGVIFIGLGCEKTNLTEVERYLQDEKLDLGKPVVRFGIQETGGTQAVIERGLQEVSAMLPAVNEAERTPASASELILGVKCGGSDGFSGLSANPALGYAADLMVAQAGTVVITEVPEFCGAEHILAYRAKDRATAQAVYEMVDWYKDYASKFGTALGENPSPGNVAGGLLNITIKSLGAIAKAGTTRVEGCCGYAEVPPGQGLWLMQGPGYDQESTPGLVGAGAQVVVFTTGRGTTIGNAIAPVVKLASNTPVAQRMSRDLDLSAGGIIDGTESIEQVGRRVFDHVLSVASGEVLAKAEESKHREFGIWAEQSVSL